MPLDESIVGQRLPEGKIPWSESDTMLYAAVISLQDGAEALTNGRAKIRACG